MKTFKLPFLCYPMIGDNCVRQALTYDTISAPCLPSQGKGQLVAGIGVAMISVIPKEE